MKKARMGKALVAVVLCGTLMWTACSTAWIGEAEQIVAALIPAAANLVTLVATLQGKNVSAADLQTIQSAGAQAGADLQLMQSLITQYQKADASAQPGLLNQIQAAMSAVQTTLNGLLPALHIKDAATQAKITAVIGISAFGSAVGGGDCAAGERERFAGDDDDGGKASKEAGSADGE